MLNERLRVLARTPVSTNDAASDLLTALRGAGEDPHRKEAQLLLAQLWLETGRGQSCNNFNPGNITAGDKWTGDWYRPPWFTVTAESSQHMKDLHEQMLHGKAPNAFRSYESFARGFADYVSNLLHTFPTIVTAARAGDALALSTAIRTSRYNPDNPITSTAASLDSLQREFERGAVFRNVPLVPPAASSPPAPVSRS